MNINKWQEKTPILLFFLISSCSASIQKPCFKWRGCVCRGDREVREEENIRGPATDEASRVRR
jgi:hypothetical protein